MQPGAAERFLEFITEYFAWVWGVPGGDWPIVKVKLVAECWITLEKLCRDCQMRWMRSDIMT